MDQDANPYPAPPPARLAVSQGAYAEVRPGDRRADRPDRGGNVPILETTPWDPRGRPLGILTGWR